MFSRTIIQDKKTEKLATHQRLDRAARRQIAHYLPKGCHFPTSREIVHFEGKNGPDGLASKKGNVDDEPWQFLPPDFSDTRLLTHIDNHIYNLHRALKRQDRVRTSFEAAWLAHMIVDGLSPSHHQPFKEQLRELDNRDVQALKGRLERMITPGASMREFLALNWKRMGPRGVGTNHIMFEFGVEFILMPVLPKQLAVPIEPILVQSAKEGKFLDIFKASVRHINDYQMYERYEAKAWTEDLARDVRTVLLPEMVQMITLGWLAGAYGDQGES
jgi:hypothetical protein